jgi:hypothetical protein
MSKTSACISFLLESSGFSSQKAKNPSDVSINTKLPKTSQPTKQKYFDG